MNIVATIFPYVIFLLIGIAIGGLVEHAIKGRSTPRQAAPVDEKTLAGEGDVEVLRAWRTSANKIWLEMDGVRLDKWESLHPDQYQRLLSLVLDLRPWLEKVQPAAQPEAVPAQPEQPPAIMSETDEEIKPETSLESIIEQIDKVLQAKLATSKYRERGIRLTEGPGGIVIIKDGVNSYEGIDSVPDPEVKEFIHQAVAEWEKENK